MLDCNFAFIGRDTNGGQVSVRKFQRSRPEGVYGLGLGLLGLLLRGRRRVGPQLCAHRAPSVTDGREVRISRFCCTRQQCICNHQQFCGDGVMLDRNFALMVCPATPTAAARWVGGLISVGS